jgi:hypothetical protein
LEFVKFEYYSSNLMDNFFAMLARCPVRFNRAMSRSLSARLAVLLLQEMIKYPLLMKTGAVPGASGFQSVIECKVPVQMIPQLAKGCDTIEMLLKYC